MSSLLLILHLAVAIVLVGLILLQRSEGGALGIGGGGSGGGGLSGLLKGRGQANGLVKFTVLLGTVFFITSLSLSIINSYNSKSVIDSVADDILEDIITSEDPSDSSISVPILE
tara:strand:+ start:1702 stop:2043 length:342 start_codon:yes stop_codon:yes gene_type:complete